MEKQNEQKEAQIHLTFQRQNITRTKSLLATTLKIQYLDSLAGSKTGEINLKINRQRMPAKLPLSYMQVGSNTAEQDRSHRFAKFQVVLNNTNPCNHHHKA